jgi:hypothetical protein
MNLSETTMTTDRMALIELVEKGARDVSTIVRQPDREFRLPRRGREAVDLSKRQLA